MAGSSTASVPPPLAARHCPGDVQVRGDPLEHGALAPAAGHRARRRSSCLAAGHRVSPPVIVSRRQSSCSAHAACAPARARTHGISPSRARPWRAARVAVGTDAGHGVNLSPPPRPLACALAALAALALPRSPPSRRSRSARRPRRVDAHHRRRRRRPRRGHEPGRRARLRRAWLERFGDPRALLHRHHARPGAGQLGGEGARGLQGREGPARTLRARRGLGRDALQLADGRARGAGDREPHLRADRPRGRVQVRRVLGHPLAGLRRRGRRNRRRRTRPSRRPPGRSSSTTASRRSPTTSRARAG